MPIVTMKQRKDKQGKPTGGHTYYIEGDHRIDQSKGLSSVSTIAGLGNTGPADGLMIWAVDLFRKTGNPRQFQINNKQDLEIGSLLHAEVEEYIVTGESPSDPSPLYGVWYSALNEMGIDWQASEYKVYNLAEGLHPYGGTLDAIGIMDGKTVLFDWKTTTEFKYKKNKESQEIEPEAKSINDSNGLGRPSYAMQLAGYRNGLIDMHESGYWPEVLIPDEAYIVYLFKDTFNVLWKKVDLGRATRAFLDANSLYSALHEKGGLYVR